MADVPREEPNPETPAPTPTDRPPPPTPWVSWAACAICAVVFLGASRYRDDQTYDNLARWGLYPAESIWGGAFWALVTSVFVHLEIWHLVFNFYWLWELGRRMEQATGSLPYLVFFLLAAVVSSSWQLAVSDTTGHGASGVVYAIFGFMWLTRGRYPEFGEVVTPNIILLFLVWLVGCFVASALNIMAIGNAAHLGGLCFGAGFAWALVRNPQQRWRLVVPAGLMVTALVPLFWCPWSLAWVTGRAYALAERKDYGPAIRWYRHSLRLGQDPILVWTNTAILQHDRGDDAACREALDELRKYDRNAARRMEEAYGYDGTDAAGR